MFAEGQIRKIVEETIWSELSNLDLSPGSFGGELARMREEVLSEVAKAMTVPAHLLDPSMPERPNCRCVVTQLEFYETGVEGTRWLKGWAKMWRQQASFPDLT